MYNGYLGDRINWSGCGRSSHPLTPEGAGNPGAAAVSSVLARVRGLGAPNGRA